MASAVTNPSSTNPFPSPAHWPQSIVEETNISSQRPCSKDKLSFSIPTTWYAVVDRDVGLTRALPSLCRSMPHQQHASKVDEFIETAWPTNTSSINFCSVHCRLVGMIGHAGVKLEDQEELRFTWTRPSKSLRIQRWMQLIL